MFWGRAISLNACDSRGSCVCFDDGFWVYVAWKLQQLVRV